MNQTAFLHYTIKCSNSLARVPLLVKRGANKKRRPNLCPLSSLSQAHRDLCGNIDLCINFPSPPSSLRNRFPLGCNPGKHSRFIEGRDIMCTESYEQISKIGSRRCFVGTSVNNIAVLSVHFGPLGG